MRPFPAAPAEADVYSRGRRTARSIKPVPLRLPGVWQRWPLANMGKTHEVSPIRAPGVALPACCSASLCSHPRPVGARTPSLHRGGAAGVARDQGYCGRGIGAARWKPECLSVLTVCSVTGASGISRLSTTPTRATSSAQGRRAERIPVSSCAFMTFNLRLAAPMPGARLRSSRAPLEACHISISRPPALRPRRRSPDGRPAARACCFGRRCS
jgi:hypothetical protein